MQEQGVTIGAAFEDKDIVRVAFNNSDEGITEFFSKTKPHIEDYLIDKCRITTVIKSFKAKAITVFIELNYVDKQYRDSYYIYYSQKFENMRRNCVRIMFFDGDIPRSFFAHQKNKECLDKAIIGFMVLRPLSCGNIGHTMLNPAKMYVDGYLRTGKFKFTLLGNKFEISAFPFSTQDGETMSCAETTLFNLMEYYGVRYPEYSTILPSDILKHLEVSSSERVLPTKGVDYYDITKVLSNMGFYPRMYYSRELTGDLKDKIQYLLHYYVESGIPIAVGLKDTNDKNRLHSISCFGHGKPNKEGKVECLDSSGNKIYYIDTASCFSSYIVNDEHHIPYKQIDFAETDWEIDCISIPLYRRVFMDAIDARLVVLHLLADCPIVEFLRESHPQLTNLGKEDCPITFRLFLTTSSSYKSYKNGQFNGDIQKRFAAQAMPKFVWVAELSTNRHWKEDKAIAEIVLDATSSPESAHKGILSLGYHEHYYFMDEKEKTADSINCLTNFLYLVYDSLYPSFEAPFTVYKGINLKGLNGD